MGTPETTGSWEDDRRAEKGSGLPTRQRGRRERAQGGEKAWRAWAESEFTGTMRRSVWLEEMASSCRVGTAMGRR